MRNYIIAAFAISILVFFGLGNEASAGKKCPANDTTCETWLRQQVAPKLTGPKAPSEPVRCVAVLSDQPSALALRQGLGNMGPTVTSWRLATLSWKQTSRGYEATVCFPKRYIRQYDALTLCGAIGHSSWGSAEMAHLSRRNVGSGDPACVGGKGWCRQRGL